MSIENWIPALSTSAFLAAMTWLLRSLILTRLKASVQFEFDGKVETLRTELRKSEETLKADLRAKESEIVMLRSGALSALANRQAVLDKRRIEAIDQLWASVIDLGPAKSVSASMAIIKFEQAAKHSSQNPKLRQVFAALGGGLDHKTVFSKKADEARPFLTPLAWALFSAYQAILSVALIKAKVLESGVDLPDIIDTARVESLIAVALPHQKEIIKKYGHSSYHYLLEELEGKLLDELRQMMKGAESDKSSLEQAAAILKESEKIISMATASESKGSHNLGK